MTETDEILNRIAELADLIGDEKKLAICLRAVADELDPPTEKEADEKFSHWWTIYPRRKGKGQARRAFKSAIKRIGWEQLRDATEAFSEHCKGKDPQFVPYPATWLNGERYDDEPDSAVSGSGTTEQTVRGMEAWLCHSDDSADIGNQTEGSTLAIRH